MNKLAVLIIPFLLMIGCSKSPVEFVKNGTLKLDDSVTVGNVLDNYKYFGKTSWEAFEDTQKRKIVQFNGVIDFNKFVGSEFSIGQQKTLLTDNHVKSFIKTVGDIKYTYIAQFTLSKNKDNFRLSAGAFNMSGTNLKTGKKVDQSIPDKNLQILREIYKNNPEPVTSELIFRSNIK